MTQLIKRNVLNLSRGLTEQADHLREQGRYQAAEKHYQKALCLLGGDRAPRSELAAIIMTGLGMTYKSLARYDEAHVYYHRALSILESQPGPPPLTLASLYHNLAGLAHARGAFEEGELFAQRAVELRDCYLGPDGG